MKQINENSVSKAVALKNYIFRKTVLPRLTHRNNFPDLGKYLLMRGLLHKSCGSLYNAFSEDGLIYRTSIYSS